MVPYVSALKICKLTNDNVEIITEIDIILLVIDIYP